MSKTLNSYVLTDNIIELMKQKLIETRKMYKEVGFSLCYKPGNNELKDEGHCIGNSCEVPIDECKNGKTVGTFHTHPEDDSNPSMQDLTIGYKYGISCIGGVADKKIRCFVKKKENKINPNELPSVEDNEYGRELLLENYFNDIEIMSNDKLK